MHVHIQACVVHYFAHMRVYVANLELRVRVHAITTHSHSITSIAILHSSNDARFTTAWNSITTTMLFTRD